MATYGQLKQALRAADQAGDTQAATKLAWAIKNAQPWVEKNQKFPDISGKPIDELQVPGTEPQQAAKPSPSLGDQLVGAGEAGLNAVTGATGGALGMLGGALGGIAGAIKEGNFGTPEAAQQIHDAALQGAQELTYQPRTEAGKQDAAAVGKVMDNVVTPVAPMAGELQGISSGAQAAGDLAPVAGDAAKSALGKLSGEDALKKGLPGTAEGAPASSLPGEPPAQAVPDPGTATKAIGALTGTNKRRLAQNIEADPYNSDYAGYKVAGGTAVKDKEAERAIKQGWSPGFVQSVKASTPEDLSAYRKMLNIFKIGKKNERFKQQNRPADIVGGTFADRVNQLFGIKKNAVKELDSAANNLKNVQVNYAPAIDTFEKNLEDLGVKINKGGGKISFSLKGSDLEGDQASQNLLNRVFERLGNTDVKSGYDLHRAKRWLDTQVEYGKKSKDGLLNATANAVKGLRRGLNQSLQEVSPAYKTANAKYADSLNSLEQIQKAVGTSKDLQGNNVDKALGQEARKLLSKYGNRVNMIDAIAKAEDTAKKYGAGTSGDLLSQVIFANELDHMFGDAASGSFRNQIRSAMESGLDAATKSKSDLALGLVKKAANKLRGVNEDNAIHAIEKLIAAQKGKPDAKPQSTSVAVRKQ